MTIQFQNQWESELGYYSLLELAVERYQDLGEKKRTSIIVSFLCFVMIIDF